MIEVGDTVKVIGTTIGMDIPQAELIPIGTLSVVQGVQDTYFGRVVRISDESGKGFWYPVSSVQKGHMEWVKDEDEDNHDCMTMKIWIMTGIGLPSIEILADNFDFALAKARNIDARYSGGQLKEGTIWPHLH